MRLLTIVFPVRLSLAPLVLFLLCMFAAFAPTALANPVTIQDASFDNRSLNSGASSTTLTPWQETGGVGNSGGYIQQITGFAAGGQNHLGMNLNHNVWQDLGVTYQANTRYTLTVAVGNRSTILTTANNQSRYILAASDGTVFATGILNASTIPVGTFADAPALVIETGTRSAAIGKTIRILLEARGSGRSHFDNIRLTGVALLSPLATTLAATEVTDISAILNGTVNARGPVTTAGFEYGPTTSYGSTLSAVPATISGTTVTAVAGTLGGLSPGTTYHYRMMATNGAGTVYGTGSTFTTETPAYLSALAVSEGSLKPSFAENVTSYAVQVTGPAIRLTPETSNASATIRVQGVEVASGITSDPISLAVGYTVINVGVTAAGSSFSKNYQVTVMRPPTAFLFPSPEVPAIEANAFDATGLSLDLSLGFAPVPGTELVVLKNTGQSPIQGTFDNLTQGQKVNLTFGSISYPFVADYFGGSGNDLVLRWATARVLAWGTNAYGQLGNNTTANGLVPVGLMATGVLADKVVTAVATGGSHSLALCGDGTLAAWGLYNDGQLGNNKMAFNSGEKAPVLVDQTGVLAGKRVIAIAAGTSHNLVLCSDGSLVSWGSNSHGQLGNNSDNIAIAAPVLVNHTGVLAGKLVTAIGAGSFHNLVLCSDGTMATWGYGGYSQLGNNTTRDSKVPVLVDRSGVLATKSVVAIAAGGAHNLALCADGTLVAWGSNGYGQLANENPLNSPIPVRVYPNGGLVGKTVTAIAAGGAHNLALCSDGAVVAWGYNWRGQLGTNSTAHTSKVPVLATEVGALVGRSAVAISAGGNFSLALCSDGSLAAWGDRRSLGNNSSTDSNVPVLVNSSALGTGERILAVDGGESHALALVASPPPPIATTLAATNITDTAVTLNGSISANGTSTVVSFEYGLSTSYGTTVAATPAAATGAAATAASAVLSGLSSQTIYHYRIVASREGTRVVGDDGTFTTTHSADLAGLTVSGGMLSPAFSSNTTQYISSVAFATNRITVTPVSAYAASAVTVNGIAVSSGSDSAEISLAVGNNVITTVVSADGGTNTRTYHLTVTRLPAAFVFNSTSDVPVMASDFIATGNRADLLLNCVPEVGTTLTMVKNTGTNPLIGTFANLGQGQLVRLVYAGIEYAFVANYCGGTGNDLVLQWANTRVLAWGYNYSGQLGNNTKTDSLIPGPVVTTGVLAHKTVTAVFPGSSYSIALCADGTVASWGSNYYYPLGNSGPDSKVPVLVNGTGVLAGKTVVFCAAGEAHSLALCRDGTLVSWGKNLDGQLGTGSGLPFTTAPALVDTTGVLADKRVIRVAAGLDFSLALCSDGTLAAWGSNETGQLGISEITSTRVPLRVAMTGALAGKSVVEIAAGGSSTSGRAHSIVLCSDGTLVAWGYNDSGQLGNNNTTSGPEHVLVDRSGVLNGKTVTAISAGGRHSLALCADGTVAAWGENRYGALGDNSTTNRLVPVAVDRSGQLAGKTVTRISAGRSMSLALCSNGALVSWGSSYLGNDISERSNVPVLVSTTALRTGERILAGATQFLASHSLALAASPPPPTVTTLAATSITGTAATLNGSVNAAGAGTTVSFEYGLTTAYGTTVPASPATVNGTTTIALVESLSGMLAGTTYHYRIRATNENGTTIGADMAFTTLSDNALLAGLGLDSGTLVRDFDKLTMSYIATVPFATANVAVTPATDHPGAIVKINGKTVASGSASGVVNLSVGSNTIKTEVTAEDGTTIKTYTITITRLPQDFVFNSAGDVPVTANGFATGGYQVNIILGHAPLPGTILTMVNNTALDFILGEFGNLAHGQLVWLSYNGERYAFVVNYYGGTGNDLVLQWAGTRVAAWGLNNYGQLGDGGNTQRLSPIAIDDSDMLADKTIFAVSTGYLHSVVLSSDGTLASWGYNVQGQLGNNALANSSVPVAVDTTGVLSDKVVVAIASGSYHNLALCSDGTVAAWGFNNHGQLGDGTKTTARTPVLVNMNSALAGKQVVAIAAGAYQSYALCSDGTIAAWGYNDEGELGNGGNTSSLVPVAVDVNGALAGRKVAAIAAGQYHTLALCTDGTVISWGYNQRGQLGNSSTADSASPVEIGSFGALAGKSVKAIAAGASHSLALCSDGTLATWGFNSQSQLGVTGINQSTTPVAVPLPDRPLTAPTAGAHYNLVRFTDGGMAAWGGNSSGQLGSNSTQASAAPVNVDTSALQHGGFIMFAASGCASSHNLAVFAVPVDVPAGLLEPSGLEAWRLEHFTDIGVDHPLAADHADFDGDGIPNLVEYAFGLNPRAHGGGVLPVPHRNGDRFEVRFSRTQTADDINYGAEWSPDLQPGNWRDVPDSGNAAEHIFSMPTDTAPSMFMRLRVRSNMPQ